VALVSQDGAVRIDGLQEKFHILFHEEVPRQKIPSMNPIMAPMINATKAVTLMDLERRGIRGLDNLGATLLPKQLLQFRLVTQSKVSLISIAG